MNSAIRRATIEDLPQLLPLVRLYHDFEEIKQTDLQRKEAVLPLLLDDARGSIWLIESVGSLVGYLAVCAIHSIEFRGVDAFLDEFYVIESHRGSGIGSAALDELKAVLAIQGVRTLTLEVARANTRAQQFYAGRGFVSRERYALMSCPLAPDAM